MKIIPEKLSVVAKVTKSYGTEGAVALRFSDSEMQTIEGSVFIFFDGFPVPFFIHSSTRKGSGSIVKFDTVNDLSHAEELVGKEIFAEVLKNKKVVAGDVEDFEKGHAEALQFLIGYILAKESGDIVGKIIDILDYPGNPCIEVVSGSAQKGRDKTMIIPYNSELFISVDDEEKILTMRIPSGIEQIN